MDRGDTSRPHSPQPCDAFVCVWRVEATSAPPPSSPHSQLTVCASCRKAGIWLCRICCTSHAVAMPEHHQPSLLPRSPLFSVGTGSDRPRLAPSEEQAVIDLGLLRPCLEEVLTGDLAFTFAASGAPGLLCFQTHLEAGKQPGVDGGHHRRCEPLLLPCPPRKDPPSTDK